MSSCWWTRHYEGIQMFYMTHKMAISYHSWNWWQFDPVTNEHLGRIKNKKNKVELPLQPNSKWNHSTNWRQSTWWDSQKSEKSNVLLHHNGLYSWHQSHWQLSVVLRVVLQAIGWCINLGSFCRIYWCSRHNWKRSVGHTPGEVGQVQLEHCRLP